MTRDRREEYRAAYFEAGLQRCMDAEMFLWEFGPLVRSLLTAEKESFESDPDRPDPDDPRLGARRSENVSLALEALGDWMDNDLRKAVTRRFYPEGHPRRSEER